MNGPGALFLIVSAIALLALPRRWAPVAFLAGVCYMTLGQGIQIGPFNFTVIRILVLVGLIRVILRRETIHGGMNRLDWILIIFAIWAIITSAFHVAADEGNPLVFRLGLVYNICGIYFLTRAFCQSLDDVALVIKLTGILLIPVALEMLLEQLTGRNLFAALGGVSPYPATREGSLRAQGPFAHPILAGTVGAACFPLMIGILRSHRTVAMLGMGACVAMVLACGSSGPILSLLAAVFALLLWRFRHLTRHLRIAAVVGYVLLDLAMQAPAYFLLGRIDLTGGSTGYHRARLIQSGLQHLDEWWFAGTDYTRHWMPSGVNWSPNHTDITNYYLKMGVWGGLPLMLIFIFALLTAFSFVGKSIRERPDLSPHVRFLLWTLGAALFAHAATSISVSYFDQSFVFLYVVLAMIASARSFTLTVPARRMVPVRDHRRPRRVSVPSPHLT